MLDEQELFRQIKQLDVSDPNVLGKIEFLRSQTKDQEVLAVLDNFAAGIAGFRLSTWLPKGLARKLMMLGVVFVVFIGVLQNQSLYWLLLLLLLPMFSPRCVGETLSFIAQFRGR